MMLKMLTQHLQHCIYTLATKGVMVYWCIGVIVYWFIGVLVYWCLISPPFLTGLF